MKKLLVVFLAVPLLAMAVPRALAQEQPVQVQCLEKEEVERLLAERQGLPWRYVNLLPSEILNGCVIRVNHRSLLINNQAYQWLGTKERGHWYKLETVREERGQVWPGLITDPREPTWVRVTIDVGGERVSTLRFSKPIRLIRTLTAPETSERVLRELNQFYKGALGGKGTILFRATCAERSKVVPNCRSFTPSASGGGAISLVMRYDPFFYDVMEDDLPNLLALLAQK